MKLATLATLAVLLSATLLPAASPAAGRANVTIGVISDVHVGTSRAKMLEETFTVFREAGVDGVIIAGDIANGGS